MKNLICLFFALLFLVSCASKNLNSKNDEKLAIAIQKLGEEYYNAGKYTAALRSLLEAHKTLPNNPYLHNSLALVYLAKQRYDLAENHFKKALDLKPDYIHAKNNLGATYLRQKKWDLAIQCFENISENLLYGTPEMPLSNLGWAYYHKRMFKKAKMYFNQSLEIRPDFLIAIHGIASIYIETGYYSQTINYLNKALKINPRAAVLHSDLAKAYEGLKDFDQARRSWDTVLKLIPATYPLAIEAQKRLILLN